MFEDMKGDAVAWRSGTVYLVPGPVPLLNGWTLETNEHCYTVTDEKGAVVQTGKVISALPQTHTNPAG